jgi:hypothetical protein
MNLLHFEFVPLVQNHLQILPSLLSHILCELAPEPTAQKFGNSKMEEKIFFKRIFEEI